MRNHKTFRRAAHLRSYFASVVFRLTRFHSRTLLQSFAQHVFNEHMSFAIHCRHRVNNKFMIPWIQTKFFFNLIELLYISEGKTLHANCAKCYATPQLLTFNYENWCHKQLRQYSFIWANALCSKRWWKISYSACILRCAHSTDLLHRNAKQIEPFFMLSIFNLKHQFDLVSVALRNVYWMFLTKENFAWIFDYFSVHSHHPVYSRRTHSYWNYLTLIFNTMCIFSKCFSHSLIHLQNSWEIQVRFHIWRLELDTAVSLRSDLFSAHSQKFKDPLSHWMIWLQSK